MSFHSFLTNSLRPAVHRYPQFKNTLLSAQLNLERVEHVVGAHWPTSIRPKPRKIIVAVTAQCNLRCIGCRYGRDFMVGSHLPLHMVKELLTDAREGGVETARLYGGEPLLHKDLPQMIRHAVSLGMSTYITTNGTLLERRIGELYDAGLRNMSIGYYGTGHTYDEYVQQKSRFALLGQGVAAVRDRYGSAVSMQLNFLLMRPSCSLEALHDAWSFAGRYGMSFRTDLIHYSLPYFTEGPENMLQFKPGDRARIEEVVRELVRLKQQYPDRVVESEMGIRSIPDWIEKGPDMRVPCDARTLIWVGADGTVKLCYVTFKLGNLHEKRLREMLFTPEHRQASRDAFLLNCPNCHCERDDRIQKHEPSRKLYSIQL